MTQPRTVPAAFAAIAARHTSRPALISEQGDSLTYAELDALRWQATRALLALGVEAGDRVAIWAPNCVEWVIAGLAIHSAGAALVPINTRMRGPEAAYVLEKSGAHVLLCVGDFLKQHYPSLLAEHRPDSLQHVYVIEHARAGDAGWGDFLTLADTVPQADATARANAVQPDSVMDILFTSGTTGLPKGVVTCHEQNLRVIADWSAVMGMNAQDRYLVVNPFFHSFGYKAGWMAALMAGCCVLPHAVFDASAVMQRIEGDRISVLPGPPTLFISLLNDPSRSQRDLSSLRATITGAAAIAPSLIQQIRDELGFNIVLTAYGLTECCGFVSLCQVDDDAETIATTCGKALPDTEVRCVDADNTPVAVGTAGEVVVRGYNVMQHYFDNPEATAATIDSEGWLHTGDIGVLDERGYLKITDRLKDMYISGGFNCYPAEIERTISAHPAVAQVAVIGIPDARMGEVGKAFIVPRSGQQIDETELIAWCRQHMANYKLPRQLAVREQLPTNASGKVLKFQLREA